MKVAVLIALVPCVTASVFRRQDISSAPVCAQTCIAQAVASSNSGCSPDDITCFCTDEAFITTLTTCITGACSGDDLSAANQLAVAVCGASAGTPDEALSSAASAVESASASLSESVSEALASATGAAESAASSASGAVASLASSASSVVASITSAASLASSAASSASASASRASSSAAASPSASPSGAAVALGANAGWLIGAGAVAGALVF